VNPAVYPEAFADPAALSRSDIANWVFDSTFYFAYTGPWELGVYNFCSASVFDGVSDAQLVSVLFGNSQILTAKSELMGSMPLETQLPIEEMTALTNRYAVSFFDQTLKHQDEGGLESEHAGDASSPLVQVVRNYEQVPARPFDLGPGDRITFVPAGEGYWVTVSSGAALLDAGTTKLAVAGGATAYLSYPGFSFPVPGIAQPVSALFVNEDGAITSRTSADYPGVDDNGSPWYMRGQLLLSNRLTIGMLMKQLDSSAAVAAGGVFGYYDSAHGRVVVTYLGVPAAGHHAAQYAAGRDLHQRQDRAHHRRARTDRNLLYARDPRDHRHRIRADERGRPAADGPHSLRHAATRRAGVAALRQSRGDLRSVPRGHRRRVSP
jgi:hypothetical protein